MEFPNARGGAGNYPRSLPHKYPLPQLFHTQQGEDMEKRSPPHNARIRTAIHVAPQDRAMCTAHTRRQQEGRAHPSAYRSPSLLPSPTDWRPTLTMGHGAHHPLPSECTQQAGAQSPSCHRNG
ncbi:hypothetical protein TcCL_ESM03236 [Trypanosoma cruzi]|nr:hypothetical protein TcCL_ESM03236 [Trypanosoma cruzi]